MVKWLN